MLELLAPAPGTLLRDSEKCTSLTNTAGKTGNSMSFSLTQKAANPTSCSSVLNGYISLPERGIAGVPDLLVEIITPSMAKWDKGDK